MQIARIKVKMLSHIPTLCVAQWIDTCSSIAVCLKSSGNSVVKVF